MATTAQVGVVHMEPKHPRTRITARWEKLHRSSRSLSRRNGHHLRRWLSVKTMPSHLSSIHATSGTGIVNRACLYQQSHDYDSSGHVPGRPGGGVVESCRPRSRRIGVTALGRGAVGSTARSPSTACRIGGRSKPQPASGEPVWFGCHLTICGPFRGGWREPATQPVFTQIH